LGNVLSDLTFNYMYTVYSLERLVKEWTTSADRLFLWNW